MNCSDCIQALDASGGGNTAGRTEVERHLAGCPACRAQDSARRTLQAALVALPRGRQPARDLWPEIAAQLGPPRTKARGLALPSFRWLAAAAALAVAAGGAVAWRGLTLAPSFAVTRMEGAPRIGRAAVEGGARLRVGQWLETDNASSARVEVATIGTVTLQPSSRLRLIESSPSEHRLELAQGRMEAFVVAPPRLFVVETPAATAIDLGCAYTITVDERGEGFLHVTAGYVALARAGHEEVVRAGMMCAMRPGFGAGTPFAADAPAALREALARFDFGPPTALPEVLSLARSQEDALMLWHLLSRVDEGQRGAVFDTLAAAVPPPPGVTRPGVIARDAAMLGAWEEAVVIRQGGWMVTPMLKKKG